MDIVDAAKGILTIENGSTGSSQISTCCVTTRRRLDSDIFRRKGERGILRALTEDSDLGFRRRSAPVARIGG